MQLSPLDSEIAHLEVRSHDGTLAFKSEEVAKGGPHVHTLGRSGAPRFRIEEPWSDDAWRVDVLAGGREVRGTVTEALELAYMEWAEGSAAENGASVLGALPKGRYLLVRSSRRPQRPSRILLGNELVERPPNAAELLSTEQCYAASFGPSLHAQPAAAWPLVGLAVLNCTSQPGLDEVLFFDCTSAPEPSSAPETPTADSRNLILVVPVRSPLVLHGGVYDDLGPWNADKRRWEERGALTFARKLAQWGP
ncbi:Hypothetical protein A7982_06411 [Minicystis rosea]|nr:Hypothetical protein A7982_06411 [Minicystis rosea]